MATVLIGARRTESIFLWIILILFIVETGIMIRVYLSTWKYWRYEISEDPESAIISSHAAPEIYLVTIYRCCVAKFCSNMQ